MGGTMISLVPPARPPDDVVTGLRRSSWTLPADPASTCRARRLVRAALTEWSCGQDPEVTEVAELLVSELVANVLRHGRGEPVLTLLLRDDTGDDTTHRTTGRVLRCEVEDEVRVPVRARGMSRDDEEGGRGLLIVDSLSRSWGVRPTRRGKAVWFELSANR
ncbi:ATP-binding protein [Microbispora sp. CA-135349]|uniref:ATP-binding protein n=1 Tax=Microbispora sp. CA-135349 TaxID=3239953 RepID=UPI003D90AF5F